MNFREIWRAIVLYGLFAVLVITGFHELPDGEITLVKLLLNDRNWHESEVPAASSNVRAVILGGPHQMQAPVFAATRFKCHLGRCRPDDYHYRR